MSDVFKTSATLTPTTAVGLLNLSPRLRHLRHLLPRLMTRALKRGMRCWLLRSTSSKWIRLPKSNTTLGLRLTTKSNSTAKRSMLKSGVSTKRKSTSGRSRNASTTGMKLLTSRSMNSKWVKSMRANITHGSRRTTRNTSTIRLNTPKSGVKTKRLSTSLRNNRLRTHRTPLKTLSTFALICSSRRRTTRKMFSKSVKIM